ncbi:NADP-dependent oxidoreductase domain-containing protein [Melampsora americana]|nr:NADP-dependent oxidoreductase domain-containing protein [Melampsora americana]
MSEEKRYVGYGPDKLIPVGPIGYGLMNLTWTPQETPDAQAFEAILTSLNAGSTFLNAGEFYGMGPDRTYSNLELLSRFFDHYPEWSKSEKCFLSVKGGAIFKDGNINGVDGSEANLRKSVDTINEKLGGKKKMDLFQMARVDKSIEIEEVMKTLKSLIEEGKFQHIGLSEVSAKTIERAHKIHPISAVEIEYSPWSLDIENNGVLETCERLQIPIIAYSPLGRGMLTGTLKSPADIPAGDLRHSLDRFKPENFDQNLKIVEKLKSISDQKSCTTTQLCLSWILSQSKLMIPIPGSRRPEGVKESLGSLKVKLNEDDLKQIRKIVNQAEVKGGRYNDHMQAGLEG